MGFIDGEKMIKEIDRKFSVIKNTYATGNLYHKLIKEIISNQPTADVVEVVRCSQCKHWIYWADSKTCSCEIHYIRTIRDDFCSYGERRTE